VIAADVTQVGVLPINWHHLARAMPGGVVPTLFADLAARGNSSRAAAALAPAAAQPAPAPTTAPHADLDELSDEDAERLLAEELER